MAEMEHLLNVYASSACKRSVAPFLGYIEVEETQARLTRGLWLMWKYEGDRTLAYYLRRRDCIAALAADLEISEDQVVPTVMQQIFECLLDLHSAGMVHRDVKPANIVFSEEDRRFKLIDLGAAADLRTGTNWKPAETILDPAYCPPEEYVLPTDAPHLAKQATIAAMAMSPLLWSQHRPDCFDSYSAGVVLLQLGLPFLRSPTSLKNWKATFARCGYDVDEWRARSGLSAKQTALLDADDGLGWDLAAGLLRPRDVETDSKGSVRFVNTGAAPRLTPSAALRHPFLKKAAGTQSGIGLSFAALFSSTSDAEVSVDEDVPAQAAQPAVASGRRSGSKGGSGSSGRGAAILDEQSAPQTSGRLSSTWSWMKEKLFDLEARIAKQASDTQTQTGVVQQLREDVAAGRASAADLQREESTLKAMQGALRSSVKELSATYGSAKGFLSSVLGNRSGSRGQSGAAEAAAPPPPVETPQAPASTSGEGSSKGPQVGKAVTDVATNAIYSGLKLTGLALNAVADLASAAERGISKAQAEAAAKKAATVAFVRTLQSLDPPVTTSSSWEATAALIPAADELAVLSERQKRQAFEAYVDALRRAEKAAADRALASFKELLSEKGEGLGEEATYADFATVAAADSRFGGVALEVERKAAFEEYMAKRQAAKQAAAAAAQAAAAASAKDLAGSQSKGAGAPVAPSPIAEADRLAELELLRAEQERLKEEYRKMEEKLKLMEQQYKVQNLVGVLLEDGSVVETEPDGSYVFKFASVPPGVNRSAADAGAEESTAEQAAQQ